jgi:hypothetical protein
VRTIFIIEPDLGFILWLGRVLDNKGYRALPAKSVSDGAFLIDQFRPEIDVLIVNPSLPGVCAFIDRVRRSHGAKVIAVCEDTGAVIPEGVIATKTKGSAVDENADLEWLDLIKAVLADS